MERNCAVISMILLEIVPVWKIMRRICGMYIHMTYAYNAANILEKAWNDGGKK